MVPYITSKFDNFISNDYMRPIIGQTKAHLTLEKLLIKKVFLVNSKQGQVRWN